MVPPGQPGDDGRVGVLVDLFEPFASAHRREVGVHKVGIGVVEILTQSRQSLYSTHGPCHI